MGWGYSFICKKCQKEYDVYVGAGEDDGRNLLMDIAAGKYGEEMRQGVDTPGIQVSSNLFLYVCDKCHNWETGPDLTLYIHDEDKPPASGIEQLEYSCRGLSVWPGERPLKPFWRKECLCKRCNSPMRMIEEETASISLACPECGEINANYAEILWD